MNAVLFRRKLIYIAAMIALLIPLYLLGQPSVTRPGGEPSPGGTLAQLRNKYDIGQADLGKIDPASESMKLATLGMRGVASSVLWQRAEAYKRDQNWDRLSATLGQIALLQPHFITVWEFQAHNLSYNVSVEFDDYRQRYAWVKKGASYLIDGTKYNKKEPNLTWYLGFIFGNKIGTADEKVQFREMFRNDDIYHDSLIAEGLDVRQGDALGPTRKPDNWLVGRLWHLKGYDLVASGVRLTRKSPVHFYSMAPMCLIDHSEAIENEGILDARAKNAWSRAGISWNEYGKLELPTTWNHNIRLYEVNEANQRLAKALEDFDAMCGQKRIEMRAERAKQLSPEQKEAYETPIPERTDLQGRLAYEASQKLDINEMEIAREMPNDVRLDALEKADRVNRARDFIQHLEIYRNQVNYGYWLARTEAEQTDLAIAARQSMYNAERLLDSAELKDALAGFDQSWVNWNQLFDQFPDMRADDIADEIDKSIVRYRKLLDGPLPDSFPLRDYLKYRLVEGKLESLSSLRDEVSQWPGAELPDWSEAATKEDSQPIGDVVDTAPPIEAPPMIKPKSGVVEAPIVDTPAPPTKVEPKSEPKTEAPAAEPKSEPAPAKEEPAPETAAAEKQPSEKPAEQKAALPESGEAPAPTPQSEPAPEAKPEPATVEPAAETPAAEVPEPPKAEEPAPEVSESAESTPAPVANPPASGEPPAPIEN